MKKPFLNLLLATLLAFTSPLFAASTATDVIDGVSSSTAFKAPVRGVTTTNITLSGLSAISTVEGSMTPADGDRFLLTGQTTASQNLIYVARSGAWTVAPDSDGTRDLRDGTVVKTQGGVMYHLTTSDPIVPGTTSLVWVRLDTLADTGDFSSVQTITALKALTGMSDGQVVNVACYYTCTTPDGGGGAFRYDAASTDTANNGTIFDPDASGAGRWERIYTGPLWVKWFGAKGDGTADDYAAIDAAIDAAEAFGGGDVCLSASLSYYKIATGLAIPGGVRLCGEGKTSDPDDINTVQIRPTAAVTQAITATRTRAVSIRGVQIDMQDMADGSIGIAFEGVWLGDIEDVTVIGVEGNNSVAIRVRAMGSSNFGSFFNSLRNIEVRSELGQGIGLQFKRDATSTTRVTATTVANVRVTNVSIGYDFDECGAGMVFTNANSESNASHGIRITNTSTGTGTAIKWIGSEISSNGGWGVTGSAGRVRFIDTVFSTNTSGDIDTSTLTIGLENSTTGSSLATNNAHIQTNKAFIGGSSNQTITASDTISPSTLKVRLTAASAITMTSDPQISDGSDGQLITLVGTSGSNSITLVDGQGLRLDGGATLGLSDTLTLEFDSGSGDWIELSRSGAPFHAGATYNPGNLPVGGRESTTVTVTGASLGDFATASFSLDQQGIIFDAYVSATDTVTVYLSNPGNTLAGSATYDPASLADAAGTTTTVTVTGAALGDKVTGVSFSNDLQGITVTGYVSAANTVSVRFQNESGGVLDLASGTLAANVLTGSAVNLGSGTLRANVVGR